MEGLILRGKDRGEQMTLDLGLERRRDDLHRSWESAAEREKRSKTKYAQDAIHPDEVARRSRRSGALSAPTPRSSSSPSTRSASWRLRSPAPGLGWDARLPPPCQSDSATHLPPGHHEPLPLRPDLPIPRGHALLARTDPCVEAIARHVLDAALDPTIGGRVATRAGVARTHAVTQRTTLAAGPVPVPSRPPRRRRHPPSRDRGGPSSPSPAPPTKAVWLDAAGAVDALTTNAPDANVASDQAADLTERVVCR